VHPSLLSFETPGAARQFDYFLKLALLGYKYSTLFSVAQKDNGVLTRLQHLSNAYASGLEKDPAKARELRNTALDSEPAPLLGLKTEEEFWRLMAAAPSVLDDFPLTIQFLGWFRESAGGVAPVA
jgi:hypothetical protein